MSEHRELADAYSSLLRNYELTKEDLARAMMQTDAAIKQLSESLVTIRELRKQVAELTIPRGVREHWYWDAERNIWFSSSWRDK